MAEYNLSSSIRGVSPDKTDLLAGEEGFEPSLTGPEPAVLPLDDSPKTDVTQSKSSPLPGLLNVILPSISPQKAAGTGQLIQSQLSNPPNPPIISPHPADINAPYQRLIFFQSNGDFRHITKHLTVIGISLYRLNGRASAYNKVATAVSGLILVMVSLALLHWVAVGARATEISSGRSPTALPHSEAEVAA